MKRIGTVFGTVATLMLALFVAPAQAAWELNLPKGVTKMTHAVWDLHMMMFWICVAIGIGVFGMMFYSIVRHRRSRHPEPAKFHESTWLEITWTIIPFCILIAVAIPSAAVLLKEADTSNPDLTIRVTGYQWLWEYNYVDSGVDFYSRLSDSSLRARALSSVSPYDVKHYLRSVTNRMVVPVDEKVRLLITSGDVIHSWWVPQLAGKKDAIPGYINKIWFKAEKTGIYRGQCAELCGRGHGFMPIVVQVVTKEQFKQWLAKQKKADKGQGAADQAENTVTGQTGKTVAAKAPGSSSTPAAGGDDAA